VKQNEETTRDVIAEVSRRVRGVKVTKEPEVTKEPGE
jgi:hypothetical protein